MRLILTNFGHRFINEQLKVYPIDQLVAVPFTRILLQTLKEKIIECSLTETHDALISNGLIEIENTIDLSRAEFRHKTNPLENISRIVFEFTTRCNFNCSHCRNGSIEKITETDIDRLKSVVNAFNLLNIKRYDFIGGEVSKYGKGWLELAKHINKKQDKTVTIYTNGWWVEEVDFEAAGEKYRNDREYLADLKQNGITHILFSIDGCEEEHDKSRKKDGLYNKIVSSFDRIKESGINPRISALIKNRADPQFMNALGEIAARMYDFPANTSLEKRVERLTQDSTNQFNSLVDIGNGVIQKKNKYRIDEIPLEILRCKAFFRPAPSLVITASGNLSVCPLLNAGEGYGNVHNHHIIELLNRIQNSFVYKLHANNDIKNYLKYLDRKIFGEHYDHICTIRTILTLLAKQIDSESLLTIDSISQINKEVARTTGFSAK